jgi:hypothetical protein
MSGENVKMVETESVKSHDQPENNDNEKAILAEKPGATDSAFDEAEAKLDKHKDECPAKDQRGNKSFIRYSYSYANCHR